MRRVVGWTLVGVFVILVVGAALSDWYWGPLLFDPDEAEPAAISVDVVSVAEPEVEEAVDSTTEEEVEAEVAEEEPERKSDIVFESLSLPPTQNAVGVLEMGWMVRNANPYRAMRAVELEYCVWDAFGEPAEHEETGESCVELVYQPTRLLDAGDTDFVTMRFQGFDSVGRVEVTVLRVVYSDGVVWVR